MTARVSDFMRLESLGVATPLREGALEHPETQLLNPDHHLSVGQLNQTYASLVSGATISPYFTTYAGTRNNEYVKIFVEEKPSLDQEALWKKWVKIFHVNLKHAKEHAQQKESFYLFIEELRRKERLRAALIDTSAQIIHKKQQVRDLSKDISAKIASEKELTKKIKRADNITDQALMEESQSHFIALRTIPNIEEVSIYEKFILLKTTSLTVKKESWKKEEVMGQFLIRVNLDLDISSLAILNITKRCDYYDHPCINDTRPCLGNIQKDLQQDKDTGNTIEFITDVLSYLQSPNEQRGYLSLPGDPMGNRKGWEQFLAKAKPVPLGFNFEMWEKKKKSSLETITMADGTNVLSVNSDSDLWSDRESILNTQYSSIASLRGEQPQFNEYDTVPLSPEEVPSFPTTLTEPSSNVMREFTNGTSLIPRSPDFEDTLLRALSAAIRFSRGDGTTGGFRYLVHSLRRETESLLFLSILRFAIGSIHWIGTNAEGRRAEDRIFIAEPVTVLISTMRFPTPGWYRP